MNTLRNKGGFSLIELMIVVAIIAVLAAIAIPWWGRYTFRARRTDGQKILMQVAQTEERYFTDYNRYTLSASSLGYTTGSIVSEDGYYTVTLAASPTASTGQGYVASAAPNGVQAKDVCHNLSIDNTGYKAPPATSVALNSNGRCW